MAEREGRFYHAVTFMEGMSLVAMLHSTATPSDTFKRDNPLISDEVNEGAIVYFRTDRQDQIHRVFGGDTPYGIAKRYGLSLDTLYVHNPELRTAPVKIGQQVIVKSGVVRYPTSLFEAPKLTNEASGVPITEEMYRNFSFDDSVLLYQVRSGESLAMIAKRFLTTSRKLKAYNGLTGNAMKAGMTLKIPLVKDSVNPVFGSMPAATRPVHTTSFKPVGKERLVFPKNYQPPFKIAIFLPLGGDTCQFPLRGMSKNALDFYMGAMMAVDSMNQLGCKGELRFFDYWSKEEVVSKVIASGEIKSFDAVVGAFHPSESELLAQYCQLNAIPYVHQFPTVSSVLQQNPRVFGIGTDMDRQLESLSQLAVQRIEKDQIVLYTTQLLADTSRERFLVENFNRLNQGNKRLIIADASMLKALLRSGRPTLICCVSLDKSKILELTVWIKNSLATNKLLGLKEWTDWKEINANIVNETDFYYFSSGCIDHSDAYTKRMHKRFRSMYRADLTRYAMLGFDVVLGFGTWISACGPTVPYRGLMLNFDYRKTDQAYHSNYGLQFCRFRYFKSEKNAQLDE